MIIKHIYGHNHRDMSILLLSTSVFLFCRRAHPEDSCGVLALQCKRPWATATPGVAQRRIQVDWTHPCHDFVLLARTRSSLNQLWVTVPLCGKLFGASFREFLPLRRNFTQMATMATTGASVNLTLGGGERRDSLHPRPSFCLYVAIFYTSPVQLVKTAKMV